MGLNISAERLPQEKTWKCLRSFSSVINEVFQQT